MKLRSLLFIPSGNRRFIEKVKSLESPRRPDSVILDLEDAIPEERKDEARAALPESVRALSSSFQVMVRVNEFGSEYFAKDLRQAVMPGVSTVLIPKVRSAEVVKKASGAMGRIERSRGLRSPVGIHAMIENASGVSALKEICASDRRLTMIGIGAGDYALDMGLPWTKSGLESQLPRMIIPVEARAAGLVAIDGVYMDLDDLESFRKDCDVSRRLGYTGRMVIHPDQVEISNLAYQHPEEERRWAERVVAAYADASSKGVGAIKVDGMLVDTLHYKLAKRIIEESAD
jgi:citrate lyase subunit beta / citryl-CoA lyase